MGGRSITCHYQQMVGDSDPVILHRLATAIQSLSDQLESKEAAEVARQITLAVQNTTNPDSLESLGVALKALAVQLPPAVAQQRVAEAVHQILFAMQTTTAPYALDSLGDALQALADQLDMKAVVEGLKSPFCVGEARTILLNELGSRDGINQNWNNLWEMVDWMNHHPEFVKKHEIDLLVLQAF